MTHKSICSRSISFAFYVFALLLMLILSSCHISRTTERSETIIDTLHIFKTDSTNTNLHFSFDEMTIFRFVDSLPLPSPNKGGDGPRVRGSSTIITVKGAKLLTTKTQVQTTDSIHHIISDDHQLVRCREGTGYATPLTLIIVVILIYFAFKIYKKGSS